MPHTNTPLRTSVGIIGHRPNRLPVEARPQVERELARVFDLLSAAVRAHDGSDRRDMVLVSALAEGADQMAARIALDQGYALVAPLPFEVSEYTKDFPCGPVRDAFRAFVDQAREVVELRGSRTREGEAYEAVGDAVITRIDILVVVWDGGASAGRGGTTEMILAAAQRGVPTIHIDATGAAPTRFLMATEDITLNAHQHIENLVSHPFNGDLDRLADMVLRGAATD